MSSDSYCPQGSVAPLPCPAGQFAASGQALCSASCVAGTYTNTSSAVLSCVTCLGGYSCAGGSAAPVVCSAGTYCVAGTTSGAEPCAAGTFNPSSLQTACQNCTAGAYCLRGSLVVSLCPIGTFNEFPGKALLSDCKTCPTINVTGSATYCAPGSSVSTTPCPAGSYCPSTSSLQQCQASTCCCVY